MIGYTNYYGDARVIREAEAAVLGGYEVDFLDLEYEDASAKCHVETIRGVRVIHLRQKRYRGSAHGRYLFAYFDFFVRCALKSTVLYFRRKYRVIHVNNMPDFLVFCTVIPKLFGAKIILDIHDPMPNTFASKYKTGDSGFFYRLLLLQERLSAWYADAVLTVHDPVKEGVLVKHGIAPGSIQVIANFADDELFRLQKYPPINGKIRLVFHGTVLERYGFRNLMLALSEVRNRGKVAVRIIGEGDFSTELVRMIDSLGLGDMVQFDRKIYPLREIPAELADCNLGLVPLEMSSITNYILPLKLLEYTSLGIPVITVRSAAIGHYFGEDDCLFYQPDDPESLRVILDKVAENPGILLKYRERALAIREKFLWSKERLKYIALLHKLSAGS